MTESEEEYRKAVDALNSQDAESEYGADLDIDAMFSEKIIGSEYSYDDALRMLGTVEQSQAAAQKAQPQAARIFEKISSTPAFSKDLEKAEHELEDAMTKAEKVAEDIVEKAILKAVPSGSVLTTLSLQDQIAELEKISIGLDENAFDKERTRIIIGEVKHLSSSVKTRKQDNEKSYLVELRNKRLAEVVQKLHLG